MEFNSNEEYLKIFPLKGPTLGSPRFADSEDFQSSPQIVMHDACQEGNPVQEEPYIECGRDGNLKNDARRETQDLVCKGGLAPVQESLQDSEAAKLVSQQVDNEMVAALVNGSEEVEAVNDATDLMTDAMKTTISEICDLTVDETVDLMVEVVEETMTTTPTSSVNIEYREGPTVIEPTGSGDLKLEETIDWMVDVVTAMTPAVANLDVEVEESSTVVTKEILEETSMEPEVDHREAGETNYHVMMRHGEKRPIDESIVKLEEAIELMADVVDANIEVIESTVAMEECGNISTVQAEGRFEEEAKYISYNIDKIMDSE